MLIVLNNGKTLSRNLSISSRLAAATIDQLQNYELMGKGKGIHWPNLDEDLSLRGFIQEEIQRLSQTLVEVFAPYHCPLHEIPLFCNP